MGWDKWIRNEKERKGMRETRKVEEFEDGGEESIGRGMPWGSSMEEERDGCIAPLFVKHCMAGGFALPRLSSQCTGSFYLGALYRHCVSQSFPYSAVLLLYCNVL